MADEGPRRPPPLARSPRDPAPGPKGLGWTGTEFEVTVGPVAHGGHCVARHEGRVVFVRHSLPGERVVVRVTEDRHPGFCRADAVEVLEASPDRVQRPCPYSGPGRCGGARAPGSPSTGRVRPGFAGTARTTSSSWTTARSPWRPAPRPCSGSAGPVPGPSTCRWTP